MTMNPITVRPTGTVRAKKLISVFRQKITGWYVYCRGCSNMIAIDLPTQGKALSTAEAHSTVHASLFKKK